MKSILLSIILTISILCSINTLACEQPSSDAVSAALTGYKNAVDHNQTSNTQSLVIVDFTKPSNEERFYIYDIKQQKATYSTLVAQGKGSGVSAYPTKFSNNPGSRESSLGTFVTTGDKKYSHHNKAINIKGIDKGVNDNASSRGLELHDAWYVSQEFADRYQRVGNSYGCFALNLDAINEIDDMISDGTVLYAYYQ